MAGPSAGSLTWNPNGTLQALSTTDGFNANNTQSCGYGYDSLLRVASLNCTKSGGVNVWNQVFTYDAFGNVTKTVPTGGTGIAFTPGYDQTTNHYLGVTYTAGNPQNDSQHSYTWDLNWGNPATIDTTTLIYDALGRMVEQQNGTTYTQVMYGPTGKVALMNGQTEIQSFQPFPAGGVFVHRPGSLTNYWRHPNWLGSSTLATTLPGRTKFYDGAYAPFGEDYSGSGTKDLDFTGQTQDSITTVGGLYDFMFREYAPRQGRWTSPDPAGLAAANLANPQSLNKYAYVGGNPMGIIDPLGLDGTCDENGNCKVTGWGEMPSDDGGDSGGDTGDYNDAIGSGGPGNGSGCSASLGLIILNFTACPMGGARQGGRYLHWNRKRFRLRTSAGAANNGFTLGIRAPGQTYKQCLAANSSTYSINNWLPSSWQNGATKFALGNDVSGALFGDANEGTAGLLVGAGVGAAPLGVGTAGTFGRRTASIFNLNLSGTTGPAPTILGKPGLRKLSDGFLELSN